LRFFRDEIQEERPVPNAKSLEGFNLGLPVLAGDSGQHLY
jgi:hypothetical protein